MATDRGRVRDDVVPSGQRIAEQPCTCAVQAGFWKSDRADIEPQSM